MGNYYNEEQSGRVTYTHPGSGEAISIPYSRDEILWPALYGVLTSVCLRVSDGLRILHSTSDILDVAMSDGRLEITLHGDRDLAGEIVFEGADVKAIQSATIGGETVEIFKDGKRVAFHYSHEHRKQFVLGVNLC